MDQHGTELPYVFLRSGKEVNRWAWGKILWRIKACLHAKKQKSGDQLPYECRGGSWVRDSCAFQDTE